MAIRSSFTSTTRTPPSNLLSSGEAAVQRAQLGASRAGLAAQQASLREQEASGQRQRDLMQRLLGYIPGDVGAELQSRGLAQSSLVAPTISRESARPEAQLEDILGQLGLIPSQQAALQAQRGVLSAQSKALKKRTWEDWVESAFGEPSETYTSPNITGIGTQTFTRTRSPIRYY